MYQLSAAHKHDCCLSQPAPESNALWEARDRETISGHALHKMLQNSSSTARRNDDDEDDDVGGGGSQYHIEHGVHRQPWIEHVDGTQSRDSGPKSTTWMATLRSSLHFRLVDHGDVSASHSRRPPTQCLVYVLDSDLQPAPLASGSCYKRETGNSRSASVAVSQSQNVVKSPTLRNLPDLTLSSSSSLRVVDNSRRRPVQRAQSDVTSASMARPPVPPKPNCLQSLPLAARYPLRRKILPAGSRSPLITMTSSVPRDEPPTTKGLPPPPVPARRGKLQPTPCVQGHLEPPGTSLPSTELPLVVPVTTTVTSAGERRQVSETTHDDLDDDNDDDEMNYKVDVCGTSMLDYVLQAANSLSTSHDVTADDDVSQQQQRQRQQQLGDDNTNNDKVHHKPATPSTTGLNVEGSENAQVPTEKRAQSGSARASHQSNNVDLDCDVNEDESLSVEVPPPDYATYAFFRDKSASVPADATVNHLARTAPKLRRNFHQNATAVTLLPDERVNDVYESIYEYVDDEAYLEPSPMYWNESRGIYPRRRSTLPAYGRRQSCDFTGRRTLPSGTLLLIDDVADDPHATGCDVTRSVLALDRQGSAFYVPLSSLRPFDDSSGQPWYFPTPLTPHQATVFVAAQRQNGCFVVYKRAVEERSAEGRPEYVLAVGLLQGEVLHYHVVRHGGGDVSVKGDARSFVSLDELVEYFRCSRGRLAARLRRALSQATLPVRATMTRYGEKYEISRADVLLDRETLPRPPSDRTSCRRIFVGVYKRFTKVLVRVLTSNSGQRVTVEDEDDFFNEVCVLSRLDHVNVVRLIGYVIATRPFLIVTQLPAAGCLRHYLRSASETTSQSLLLQMCRQMSSAVAYLAACRFIVHRQLSAYSFYIDENLVVQLADFGRARAVVDDEFIAETDEQVWVKWAAPEVLRRHRYTTKSDVWALAVVFWEVYSGGAEPYEGLDAEQTAVYVDEGGRMDRPDNCPVKVYQLIRHCWSHCPADRPSARQLFNLLATVRRVDCDVTQQIVESEHNAMASTTDSAGGDVLQLPRQRQQNQSLVSSRPRRLGGAFTRALSSKHKWPVSLVVSPPPLPPTPSTAPPLTPSPSLSLSPSQAGATAEKWSRLGLSTLSVPDGRRRTRGGNGGVRPRSNASTQSSDDRSDLTRDGHLSSCESADNDNDNDNIESASQTKNARYGLRKLLDKMSPTNNSASSVSSKTGANKQ